MMLISCIFPLFPMGQSHGPWASPRPCPGGVSRLGADSSGAALRRRSARSAGRDASRGDRSSVRHGALPNPEKTRDFAKNGSFTVKNHFNQPVMGRCSAELQISPKKWSKLKRWSEVTGEVFGGVAKVCWDTLGFGWISPLQKCGYHTTKIWHLWTWRTSFKITWVASNKPRGVSNSWPVPQISCIFLHALSDSSRMVKDVQRNMFQVPIYLPLLTSFGCVLKWAISPIMTIK